MQWLGTQGWSLCPVCGRTSCARRNGGVHDKCANEWRAMRTVDDSINQTGGSSSSSSNPPTTTNANRNTQSELATLQAYERALPSIPEIFTQMGRPKEYTHKSLNSKYREVHGRLVAKANQNLINHAWEAGPGNPDSISKAKTRIAWIEEAMFYQAVLLGDKRGMKAVQTYGRASNRLERWEAGERKELWLDVKKSTEKQKRKKWRKKGPHQRLLDWRGLCKWRN